VITPKNFHTTYKVGKENQSLRNSEFETDLQELNRIDMGYILHSANPFINIMKNISDDMGKI
jgi:hypothetical protein